MNLEKICSVIVSVYNEEDSLEQFYQHCSQSCEKLQELGYGYEIVFVNDGSQDKSAILLEDLQRETRNTCGYCLFPGILAMRRL